MSTEKHQLRVDVIGHTVVGGHCVANNGWHNEGGGIVVHSIPTAFHQGTKSGKEHTMNHQIDPTNPPLCFRAFLLTGNTVPASGRNICLRCRPRCSRPGVETQKSHSAGEGSRVLLLFAYRLLEIPADSSQAACLHEAGRFQCSSVSHVAPEPSILLLFSQGGHDVSAFFWCG